MTGIGMERFVGFPAFFSSFNVNRCLIVHSKAGNPSAHMCPLYLSKEP